jgi:hypothetical protein
MAAEAGSAGALQEPRLAELVHELIGHLERLGSLRWRLVRVQAHEALTRVQRGLVLMVFAILVGLLGALSLVAAMMMALAEMLPPWAAAAIVGVCLAVVSMVLFAPARRALSLAEPPRSGIEACAKGSE